MQNKKCIAIVLKGLEKKIVTRPLKQKKLADQYSKKKFWQPLLLRDKINFKESSEKEKLFRTSAVNRYWDKAKAHEMISSGPLIPEDTVTFLNRC